MSVAARLVDVQAGYGKVDVLRGVSLDVARGEFVAIFGPNGAGKTTLLNAIAGHVRVTGGTVEVLGADVREMAAHRRARRGLAFIGDDRQLFPSLTLEQTLRLVPGATTEALSHAPELRRLSRRRVRLLSGGEQQILAVARMLAAKPSLIVIDELSQGLAPLISVRLLGLLRAAADGGAAVLVVEQGVDNALRVADRGVVLKRGQVVDDRPASVWAHQRDELAELFLT